MATYLMIRKYGWLVENLVFL